MLDLVIGKRELGKTTFAVSLTREFPTRVIYDPRHMIHTTDDILTGTVPVQSALYEMLNDRAEIIVRPDYDMEGTFTAMCEGIDAWIRDNPGEAFCLLLDEARFIKAPEAIPQFDFIVRCTPRSNVTVILTCHGVVDVSPDLRRIADYWILFLLTMEADLDRVRERCGDTVADEVQKLNSYEYIVWNDANSTWRKHTERQRWYVPLERQSVAL